MLVASWISEGIRAPWIEISIYCLCYIIKDLEPRDILFTSKPFRSVGFSRDWSNAKIPDSESKIPSVLRPQTKSSPLILTSPVDSSEQAIYLIGDFENTSTLRGVAQKVPTAPIPSYPLSFKPKL